MTTQYGSGRWCFSSSPRGREGRDDLTRVALGAKPTWARVRRHYLRAAVLTLSVVAVALAALSPDMRRLVRRTLHRVPDQVHVAVLPFENVGGEPANQAFCDGLMETLSAQLTMLGQSRGSLWVVPAVEVRRRDVKSPSEARKLLGVNLVVTGSVQCFSDRFRVTLNLIDPAQGEVPRQLHAAMIDNRMERVSVLQNEAVMRMIDMLGMEMLPEDERRLATGRTTISAAFDFYLQGVGYVRAYETAGNLDLAIQVFSMAIDHDSSYALAHAGLGEACWRKYRDTRDAKWIDLARDSGRHAAQLDSTLAAALVVLGMIDSQTGRPEEAVKELEKAIAIEPKNDVAYRALADAFAAMNMPAEAEASYQRAIAVKPDYWGGYNDLGMYYFARSDYGKARDAFTKVTEFTPENHFGYNNLGAAHWGMDQIENARDMFLRSIELAPNYRAYDNLGALLNIMGSWVQAAEMCEQALALNRTSYATWANLGNAYYWMPGKRDEAMTAYREAARLAEAQRARTPGNANLLSSLAAYHAVLGEDNLAQQLIDEAVKLAPDNSRVIYFAGHTYEEMGQRDKALVWIERAIDKGYPVSELERDPWLHELRNDDRYTKMISGARPRE